MLSGIVIDFVKKENLMKKKMFLLFSLLLTAALLLVACGGGEEPAEGETPAAGETVSLRLWTHQNNAFNAGYEALIDAYMDANPDVEITLETFDYDLYI
jgi:multiple sugar transport system substrate-binding protein